MRGVIESFGAWIIIGVVCMVNNCGCSGSFQYAPYSSKVPGLRVSLEYISGWKVQETRGDRGSSAHVIFIENSTGEEMQAFMSVTATPLGGADTPAFDLQSAAEDIVKKRSQFKGFSVISRSAGTLAGSATQELLLAYRGLNKLYRTDAELIPIKERIVLCLKGGTLYSFIYQSSERRFDAFNKAFNHVFTTLVFKTE
ncbi:MAG: hypothetical protein WC335_01620 [Candidatus Omnitrophota bacterium]|jgi:hypothetical protein